MAELNIDTFGEIMNDLITKIDAKMLIEMPEGTQNATVSSNIGIETVEFYMLLAAIPTVFKNLIASLGGPLAFDDMGGLVDGMCDMVRNEMLAVAKEAGESHDD